jgi:formylglycine-generating enzyme required for sulfatase activity
MTEQFDVFLCHNSEDKPQVIEIAEQLKQCGLRPWLDKWELRPGHSWQDVLEENIEQINAAAVFVGKNGLGPWQRREINAFLRKFVSRECPVIPILLPDAPKEPKLPTFLEEIMWVDFRTSDPDPMSQLIWGITGEKIDQRTNVKAKTNPVAPTVITEILPKGILLEMVKISAGSFLMGTEEAEVIRLCKEYETDWFKCEMPQHRVNLKEFYLGKYPVTQEQYQAIMGNNPSNFKDNPKNPVENVSWNDAQEFCQKLNDKTKKKYRLPSEAEWEYACRAGTTTSFYFGETISTDQANYDGNYTFGKGKKGVYREKTTPVGNFPANKFGLYDLHGNVWEWCEDPWHENYENAPKDGSSWNENYSQSTFRLLRGGSWNSHPRHCRSAYRNFGTPASRFDDIGFRVVCAVRGSV